MRATYHFFRRICRIETRRKTSVNIS